MPAKTEARISFFQASSQLEHSDTDQMQLPEKNLAGTTQREGSLQNLCLARVGKGVQHAEAEQGPRIGSPTHGGGVFCMCARTALSAAGAGPERITVNVPGHRASSLAPMSSCGDLGCLLCLN